MSTYRAPLQDMRFVLFDVLGAEALFAHLGFTEATRDVVDAVLEEGARFTETVLAPEGKVRLIDLIEEELLLALPLVPLHEHERADEGDHESAAGPVQRPFERLGELLKRQR